MRQIRYNFASNVLRFEFPVEWDGSAVSAVTLAITDLDGDELLAAQSLTLYTATSLDADADRFAEEIVLDSGAGALDEGDPILIDGIMGAELNRVKGFDSTTKTTQLEQHLKQAHAEDDAVYGLWGTYTLDTTTVATWTAGLNCRLLWTPTGSGEPVTELAQISKTMIEIEGLERRFSRLFSRAYNAFTDPVDRLSDMVEEAKIQVEQELDLNNVQFNQIVDQDFIATAIMYKMRLLWTEDGDEKMKDEQVLAAEQYAAKIAIAQKRVTWIDHDQDAIEDDGETTDHEHTFRRKAW